jgi:hypothetical protein
MPAVGDDPVEIRIEAQNRVDTTRLTQRNDRRVGEIEVAVVVSTEGLQRHPNTARADVNHLDDVWKPIFVEDSAGNGVCRFERPRSHAPEGDGLVEDVLVRVRLSVLAIEQCLERVYGPIVRICTRVVMRKEHARLDEDAHSYSTSSMSSSVVVTPDETIPS